MSADISETYRRRNNNFSANKINRNYNNNNNNRGNLRFYGRRAPEEPSTSQLPPREPTNTYLPPENNKVELSANHLMA